MVDEELNKLENFWLVEKFHGDLLGVLLHGILIISFVSDFFLLKLSDFLKFVVVNVELLSIESSSVKLSLGTGSHVWGGIADKSVESLFFLWKHLKAFDLTESLEEFHELVSGGVLWEVLNVKVASLL